MTAYFVTATGTDIGKSFVCAGLIRALRRQGRAVDALKPVISGFDPQAAATSDTGILLDALGRPLSPGAIDRVSPWRFAAPLSPDMAAAREGRTIDFDALVTYCADRTAAHDGVLLIEGVGGVMVPLDGRHTVLDWMAALGLPGLLVCGSYLGSLSHTLTALEVLNRRGIAVRAVIVNETPGSTVDLMDTAQTVRRFAETIEVVALPRGGEHAVLAALSAAL
jgi:dethiobiotin synthetase